MSNDEIEIISQQPCVNCGKTIYIMRCIHGTVSRQGCVHAKFATMETLEKRADRLTALILSRGDKKQNTDS